MKPYVVVSPPFDPVSGGVRVMYGLYGWLLAKGQIAYLNQKPIEGDFIAIYPEIEHGNPAGASTVVRYILNKPGVVDAIYTDGSVKKGPTEFPSTDKIYYFSRLFGEAIDDKHYMFLPIINMHQFKDQKKKRDKVAYFVGKGRKYDIKFIHPSNAINIEREDALDQQGLADLLNECQVLYVYDPVSAMTEIARLCGCRVVMVNPVYERSEFLKYEAGMNGISWGEDTGVPLEVKGFREHYRDMRAQFSKQLDEFIKETQK